MATTVTPQDEQATPQALALAKPKAPPQQPQQVATTPQLSLAAPAVNTQAPAPTIQAPAQPVDRVALAGQAFDTFAKAGEPAYQRNLTAVTQQAAGMGQLGSGQWRTALRDEAGKRQLELDTARDTLLNRAIEGSIADASTAFQQGLAGSQQNLAAELGRANVDIARQGADTSRIGTLGSLELQKSGQEQAGQQFQQSLALQEKQQEIEAAYRNGTLTLAQRDQALRELQNSQQYGLAGQQLDFQRAQAEIENQFKSGQLTLAQREQALRELAQQQSNTLATGQLELARENAATQREQFGQSLDEQRAGRLQSAEQFRASLAENARQFGLSQDQQMALAKLSDATANRQIDVSTAQGKNQLLVQLASIIGGPTGQIDPAAFAALVRVFGLSMPYDTGVVGEPPSVPSNPYTTPPTGTGKTFSDPTNEPVT